MHTNLGRRRVGGSRQQKKGKRRGRGITDCPKRGSLGRKPTQHNNKV